MQIDVKGRICFNLQVGKPSKCYTVISVAFSLPDAVHHHLWSNPHSHHEEEIVRIIRINEILFCFFLSRLVCLLKKTNLCKCEFLAVLKQIRSPSLTNRVRLVCWDENVVFFGFLFVALVEKGNTHT